MKMKIKKKKVKYPNTTMATRKEIIIFSVILLALILMGIGILAMIIKLSYNL